MATITRANLRARIRRYADFPNTDQGLLDTDLNDMINDKAAHYYDLLVGVRGHSYFETTGDISVISGTARYSLPSDFYQLSTVSLNWSATEIEQVSPAPSNRGLQEYVNSLVTWDRDSSKAYRLTGDAVGNKYITFYPTPTAAVTARLRYVPSFTPLTAESGAGGVLEAENAWFDVIAYDVAAEFRGLKGLPYSYQIERRDEQRERILEMATERLQDDPAEIVDTEGIGARVHPYPRWNSA